MNRIARIGATGAVLTLASLPLLPAAAMAKAGPSLAQDEQSTSHLTKAQIEYQERSTAALRLHYGTVPSHPTKAQIEFNERTAAGSGSGQGTQSQPQTQLRVSDDAAVWQLAVSAAAGALITGGVVLASRGMSRNRHAMAG